MQLYEEGLMSQHIKSWEVGSIAEWKGPFGDFSYIPNKFKYIGMLAAGTGITPLYQVACSVVDNENDETMVHLVYACRTASEVLMKKELDRLSEYWNFTVIYVLSQDPDANQVSRYGDRVVHGRITATLLSREVPPACLETLALICGTPSFNKDVIVYLQSIGYDDSMYFKF
jgi:cytochrome-b5 reductase